ncbi:type II toxin-antitoxin system HipA family toxin [Azohydromonas sp. G-1-1-14]|uniref:Type II toxin-antitoxin system HipA family toxin n=2 Tax=Azohydromonas caseinilytica TaxID=2728836 RepID=A0A848FHC1_9BURK|nr:HipA domain-containing protein [Azohydromonas caseinilytica]NML17241.1 type II toxin-antitoxin system HipA family toxin [Azohydromonas caseinilytica]
MNGELVGTWTVERGTHVFRYEAAWKKSSRCRSLSLSLPLTGAKEIKGDLVRNYFDNLLPDSEKIRQRLGRRFKTPTAEVFDLLEAIGRDCVGAVQLLPPGESPEDWKRVECEHLSEQDIVDLLQAVPSELTPEGMEDDDLFRISMAGAQEKTALTRWQGAWCRPHGATPSTHIFKLPLGLIGGSRRVDASDSVQNEWLCAKILEALGLPMASTSMETFGEQTVLIVERFDREWQDDGTWIARLPQEDFCQALGFAPSQKYEAEGGPGMAKCLQLLQGSRDKDDPAFFLLTQLTFFLLAATDGHAKNFSIYLEQGDHYRMTPLHDVLSMWPYFGDAPSQFKRHRAGLAMTLRSKNPHKYFHTIEARHWRQLALKNGGPAVWEAMQALVEGVDDALHEVQTQLPPNFPERTWTAISTGMKSEANRFMSEAEGLPPA